MRNPAFVLLKELPQKEMTRVRNRKKGFTLSEVLIATLLFSLCIVFVSQLMTQSLRSFKKYRAEANAKRRTDDLLNQISSEVRSAYTIEVANQFDIVFCRYTSDNNSYRVEYIYDPTTKEIKRKWWQIGKESSVYGSDVIGTEVETFDLKYIMDLSDPTMIALIRPQVGTGSDEVGGAVHEYKSQTKSKRRVVKRADFASCTTE